MLARNKQMIYGLGIFLLIFTLCLPTFAQETGMLKGTVTDQENGEELHDVDVLIEGTVLGASTRLNGTYEIVNIQPGTYPVTFIILGYQQVQESVTITAGETAVLDIQLVEQPVDISEVLIEDDRAYSAASSHSVRKFDIRTRPSRTAHEMLQMAPGIFIAQHAGGGKAEQIFIRGFDADHGTDISISVDGVPTNMISHGHGQGYADLHYIIPDVVEAVEVYKGPYFAEFGNLATAGAVEYKTREHIEENVIRMEGGAFNTARLTTVLQVPTGNERQNAYVAGQFYQSDGPVDAEQNFDRFNFFGKLHTHLSANSKLSLTASAFSSGWDASGQVPLRAVNDGTIDRFGAIDDLEGGTTSRQDVNLQYLLHGEGTSELMLQTYATRYNFKLYSNFTFFLDDPDLGDMIEQTDQRQMYGLNSYYTFSHPLGLGAAVTTFTGGFRNDDISVSLWRSPNRQRLSVLNQADIFERNFFLSVKEELIFTNWFRMQLGLRGDYFTFNVEDPLDRIGFNNGLPHASGYAKDGIISPKINMVFSPANNLDIFVNAGTGFHSNDARNVVIGQRVQNLIRAYRNNGLNTTEINDSLSALNYDPEQSNDETLPRAIGGELGFRTRLAERINLSAAFWLLDLEREYVFVGDAGTTEFSDPTRRMGVDLEARVSILPWLWGDLDVNIAEGKVKDAPSGEDNIALAPTLTATGGLTVNLTNGFDGSIRVRHIDDRPANETNSVVAEGYTLLNLSMGYRIGRVKFLAALENVLDTDWNEAQFDTESQLRGESDPVSEIHFTPGNPRNVQVGISYHF